MRKIRHLSLAGWDYGEAEERELYLKRGEGGLDEMLAGWAGALAHLLQHLVGLLLLLVVL